MSYMNERLRTESSYIKNNFLKINQFFYIITNVVEKIDKFPLYKEPSRPKDKISTLALKFCNLQRNNDSKGKDLNLMHVNIRGLRRNIEELIFTLDEKKNDIASINGMFLRPKHKITIPGYKIVRKDRSTGQRGGVALIVKDNISFDSFELNINNNRGNVEYITITINTKSLNE